MTAHSTGVKPSLQRVLRKFFVFRGVDKNCLNDTFDRYCSTIGKTPIINGHIAEGGSVTIVSFKPTGAADPRRAEFNTLEQLLDARIQSGADLAEIANARVDVTVIDRLSERGLKLDELSFIIPRRTLTHRRQHHERLSIDESDKAIRLAKILAQAMSIFGDPDKAMVWLRSDHARFLGKSALDMASTEHGARLVEEALVQIDEGYFA
jgi:putative toxin-antitoxin system antitoxin component (TIGR02293 family)